jgi:hypothetical protein
MRTTWKPVLGLLFLAPLVGEFLLGNVTIRDIGALILLAPLYGGGALVIREVARRTGKGRPTILALGLAYGIVEAGVIDGSLFSASYEGVDYNAVRIPVLGVSAFYALQFVINHAVWSISIPILLTETLTPRHRTTPWLGRAGLAVVAAVYVVGAVLIRLDSVRSGESHVTGMQTAGVVLVALVLIAVAITLPGPATRTPPEPATHTLPEPATHALPEPATHTSVGPATHTLVEPATHTLVEPTTRARAGWVPRPLLVGVAAFALSSAYFALPATWHGVAWTVKIVVLTIWLVSRFSRRGGWQTRHQVALAAGALGTYAWAGFLLTGIKHDADPVAFAGNAVFTVGGIALVGVAFRGRRTVTGATQEVESSRKA